MATATFQHHERIGLGLATLLHIALLVALVLQAQRQAVLTPLPERMEVSLAEDVALEATATNAQTEAQAAIAPVLADRVTIDDAAPEIVRPIPKPSVKPVEKPSPKPSPKPSTKPIVKPTATPKPKPSPTASPTRSGGSRIGEDFLAGSGSSEVADPNAPVPASQIGASEKASLQQAIARQLKPFWSPPSGADASGLITILEYDLNPDGSLAGRPRVVRQTGVNDSNKAQAARHAELAIRAVQRAAPFKLPPRLYNAWKRIRNSRFDWNLSQ